MMTSRKSDTPINISQNYILVTHQTSKVYPIPVNDWNSIKDNVNKIKEPKIYFSSAGWLFLGVAVSCFLTYITTEYLPDQIRIQYTMLFFGILSTVIGLALLYIANIFENNETAKSRDILAQMELIENRFQTDVESQL